MANKRKSYDELLAERNGGANKDSISVNSASGAESTRKSYDELLLERNAPSDLKKLESDLKKYFEDSYAFSNTYSNRFFDSDNNYKNQYRTNTSDWLSIVGKAKEQNEAEAKRIQSLLDTYKSYISEDAYTQWSELLSNTTKAFSDMYNFSAEDDKTMSQFENEDAYKAALAASEVREKQRTYDIEAGWAEIEALKAERDELRARVGSDAPSKSSDVYEGDFHIPDAPSEGYYEPKSTPEEARIQEIEKQIEEKEKYIQEAERIQAAYKLSSVAIPGSENYDPNFEYYAQLGETVDNPSYEDVQRGEGEIQNPVKYVKENFNKIAAGGGMPMNGRATPLVNGMNVLYYEEMEDDEYKVYNYYLAQDSINSRRGRPTNNAEKYLDSLNLKGRWEQGQLEWYKGYATEHPWAASGISVITSLGSGIEYLEDIFNSASTGEVDRNYLADVTNKIRGTVSENVDWEIGNWDAFDFVYNTAMSGVDSIAASFVPGGGGGFALGLSAAAQGTNDALDRGMNGSQAFWSGLTSGVFEGLFESVSIGQFDALKDSFVRNGRDFAKNLAKTMLVNASEETLTEIANLTYDRIVNGDFSHYAIDVRKYMEMGMTESEAKRKVAIEQGLQVVEAGASGGLMGVGFGTFGGAANAVSSYRDGKAIKTDGKVDNLVDLGKTFSPDSDVYKFAEGINGDSSSLSVGRLLKGVQGELSGQNMTDIQNALVERGVSEQEAANLAKWMNKVVNGGTLSKSQQAALENNPVLAEVLYGTIMSSDSSVMKRGSLYNQLYNLASSMGVDRQALEAQQTPEAITQRMNDRRAYGEALRRGANSRMGLSEADIAQIDEVAAKIRESSAPAPAKIADVADKVSDTGETIVKSTNEEVSIKKIASIDTKKKTMMLELSNGKVVDSKDIAYGDNNQAALYESVLLMGYDAHTANAIVSGYTANNVANINDYLLGTNTAFNYGWSHVPEKARKGVGYDALTQTQKEQFVKLGEEARAADDKARGVTATQKQSQVTKKKQKDGYRARINEGVDINKLSPRAKESVKALDAVAKALKINIVVADLNGNSYGFYNPATNELYVDKNAGGKGKDTLLFTASHELVHYIRNWSPTKFTILADFLMEQYATKGENIDKLIEAEIAKAYKATRGKHKMTFNEAYEEVVAQAMQRFLTDSNFIERLAALQKKDANLAKRLVSKLKEILNKIRDAYRNADTPDRASQAVKEMGEAIDELYAKMEEALISASEVSQGIGARNFEDFSEAKNTDGETLFQYKAMEADEDTYRQMLKKHGIMSEAEINNLFNTIDKALVIIKDNLEILDYAWEMDIDDRSFSPVKPNSDNLYKVSLDFSTLCRKRILQQVIQTQLQDALNKPLSREESIAIRDELMKIQEEGRQIEIACALCYVESARMKSPAQIKKFLKDRDNIIKEFLASKSGGDIKQKIKQAEADARERLGVGNATLKSMPDKIAEQIREAKRQAKKSYTPTAEEQELIDAAKKMSVTDFTSPEGLANLAKNYPVLFDAYTSFVRNATKSKGIEKDTWWRAGDSNSIGDTLIANMNRENGLRSQSWSDFQVIHLLDYIAATIELSTRNAKEQAYSKVPDYIALMGNTGVMLNMSLIPMAKFNGKLEYDSVEGMAYKKALELREKYHATAGTICIGISDEQIKMLLDDSTIDYVIPYHKSGMAAHIRKLMHIPTWSEYEKYQNETNLSRAEAVKQAKKYGVKLLSESDENYQKHTDFSEWFDIDEARRIAEHENAFPSDASLQKKLGKMYGGYMAMQNAANNYLKLCAERGIAPKFSHENANFTTEANYWKLLIDRKMVDNVTGEIIEQQVIKPIFDEGEILRILNDELERYPGVKADQDYATRTVVEKFLSGEMNKRLDADTVAAIMQKPVDNITTTNIIASEEGIKAQYAEEEDIPKVTANMTEAERYEVLKDRSLNNMPTAKEISPRVLEKIPKISSWDDINKYLGNNKRSIIRKIAEEFGAFDKEYFNEDIKLSFEFTRNNFAESYNKKKRNYVEFAKLFSVFDAVVENAVGVEVHNRKNYKPDPTLDNIFVLMSAYQDGEFVVPVKLEVKKFKDKQNTLYVAITLEKIKKTEVWEQGNTENGVTQDSRSVNISIAKIFAKINPSDKNFLKYIPDGFLNNEQRAAKQEALREDLNNAEDETGDVKHQYIDTDSDGNKLSEGQKRYFRNSKVRDEKGRLLAVYHGTKSAGFTTFTKSDEIGYFFARHLRTSRTYAGGSKKIYAPDRYNSDAPSENANYKVYLNLENPYIFDGKGANWNNLMSSGENVAMSIKLSRWNSKTETGLGEVKFGYGGKTYKKIFHNPTEFSNFVTIHLNAQMANTLAFTLNNVIDEKGNAKLEGALPWDFLKSQKAATKNTRDVVREAASKKRYDGVIFKSVIDSGDGSKIKADDLYVAFDSDQIKSVNNLDPTHNPDIRYQYKGEESIDNRDLLAKALEGAAKTDVEKQKLKEYKSKVALINAEEKKLREFRAQIKEISFSKGPRDTKKLKSLQFEANQAANRINTYDKQLLRLESTQALANVLQREKDLLRKKMMQKQREAVKAVKERDMATMREIMDRYTESRKKAVERRDMSQIRNKIKAFKAKLESNLLTPTDRGYVPFGLAQAMIDVCSLIDTDTDLYKKDGNINKSQVQRNLTKDKLQALKDEYEKLKDYDDPIYSGEFDEAIYLMLKDLKENYEGRSLKEMTLDELSDMYDILRSIGDTLVDARNLIGKGEALDVYEAGDAIISEQREVAQKRKKDKRSGAQKAKDNVINLSLSPVRNIERMSGYKEDSVLVDLFNDFEIGVRQKNFFEMEAKKSFEAVSTGENAKAYESAVYDAFGGKEYMDAHGKKFSISKMQMMQAILSQDRERANNMYHIKGGGLVFADLKLLRKGDLRETISSENSHLVSDADGVVEQFRQDLANDKWAQEYMAAARSFFDGKAKDAINNTMLTLKHRIVAKDKSYIPFEVDKNFVAREISAANDIQQTINSYGMLQETKDKAPQPLIMTGLNNIIDRHIDQVSSVVGLAVPVRNFNKVWNVHSVDGVDTTVNNIIETNWGKVGKKFIEQVVQDIQGPRLNNQSKLYKAIKSGYIGATFLLNGSVVTKQVGSMLAATSMLEWRNPASMMGNLLYTMANYKKIAAEVDKYTASAWMRRQGMSDAEVYSLLTEGKKHPITKALNKLPAPLNPTKWIVGMDSAVALSLWKYAKQDVQKAHPELSGEELNRATASFYDSLIENTQSMTDVLHRPEIQKRSDIMSEAFGMFKTDLYQMSGQLQNAVGKRKNIGRTVYSIAASAIWGQLMTTLFALLRYKVNPYRDDEEDDELTVESWLKRQSFAFGGDFLGYFFPLFGSEVMGTIENIVYGESEDIADSLVLTAINDLYSTTVSIASSLKEGEAPSVDDYKKLLTKSLQAFGIPANNIMRTIDAIRLHAKDIANGEFLSFEAGRDKSNGQRLYEAILRGNEAQVEDLKLEFNSDSAIESALVKAIQENNPDVAKTASEYINGNLSAYEDMVNALVRQGFDEDVAVRAIRSVITKVNSAAQLKADGDTKGYKEAVKELIDLGYDADQLERDIASIGKTPSAPDDSDEASSIYKAADINLALEKGNATTARKIIDELVQVKIENYMANGVKKSEAKKKAEASVKSSITSYWKPLYLEAKANKNLSEVQRIKALLRATKLYDNVTETTDDWWDAYRKSK